MISPSAPPAGGTHMVRAESPARATPTAARSARLLVVDDDHAVCRAIALNLRAQGYEVEAATSAPAALARLHAASWDVMLCDVRMPDVSGLELLRKAIAIDEQLAVIMLTGVLDAATATTALRGGALDYITKPFQTAELFAAVEEALRVRRLRADQRRVERLVREEVAKRTEELEQRTAELEREQRALHGITVSVAESLINAMEAKDLYLRGHSLRVAALGAALAEELGLGAETVERVRLAGRLHDVGKIGIREAVLNKPGPLTADEYAHVKEHVRLGIEILAPLPHLGEALTFVHHHHEHWDGGGYPQGLRGNAISVGGRILTAADTFDALTSARAYRAPLSREDALALIARQNGKLLEPDMYDALVRVAGRPQSLVFLDVA
jgi:putative two-component system response regulator